MSQGAVRAARARLGQAGRELRARPTDEVLASLARVLDGWSESGGSFQRDLVADLAQHAGFSQSMVREGLSRALTHWNGEALYRLVARELGTPPEPSALPEGFSETACVLAGSIPMPTLQNLLLPLIVRSPVLAKTGVRDRVTAKHVARSLARVDPLLGRCVEVVDFRADDAEATHALLEAPCVVATGSDASLEALSQSMTPSQRFVGYGHRMSLAVVGSEGLLNENLASWAERLARDTALWDQMGCLSPAAVYCVGSVAFASQVSTALAQALAITETRWPRGPLAAHEAAAIRQARDDAQMRKAASEDVEILASPGTQWTVVREPRSIWRDTPLRRFLRVYSVTDPSELPGALESLSPWLATVALDGFAAHTPAVKQSLLTSGVTRIVSAGNMQTPDFGRDHDEAPLLLPLLPGAQP